MEFIDIDLGQCQAGDIAEITLSGGANVRRMDSSNFNAYRNGRDHRYIGGLALQPPVRLRIPRSGRWHAAVEMQGLRGSVRASGRRSGAALQPLPPIREQRQNLEDIGQNLAALWSLLPRRAGIADGKRRAPATLPSPVVDRRVAVEPASEIEPGG